MSIATSRLSYPLLVAVALVGLAVSGLLVGYAPIGGDPDCLYRPIKAELGRALREGSLPLWSDRFGVGAPLAAESHVAAFYPPNWVIYSALPVRPAYALSMWLHYVVLVVTTYGYARALGITPWGAALAGVAFALSGFQMSHACHEPFYSQLPYLPLALWQTERYMATGQRARLAGLALTLGAAICLGHFQIQTWTAGLVALTAIARAAGRVGSWKRALAVFATIGWGIAMAAPQLGLTSELTRIVGFDRPPRYLSVYSFPPAHWAQLALPGLFMGFRDGPRSAYWGKEFTSSDEAALYVGTATLIFAAAGWLARRDRRLNLWRWLAPLGLLLATLPRLWPDGFDLLTQLPILGHFRAPGRYTLLTTLGLSLLAGRGFDRTLPARRFWIGAGLAATFGVAAIAWSWNWLAWPNVTPYLDRGDALRLFGTAVVVWVVAMAVVVAWWKWSAARGVGAALPLLLVAAELTYLYHKGTVPHGWPVRLSTDSPIFARLGSEARVDLVGGPIHNLPAIASPPMASAFPYLAIFPPPPNYLLRPPRQPHEFEEKQLAWLVRSGVTHGVFEGEKPFRGAEVLYAGPDRALDRLIPPDEGPIGRPRVWRLERYDAAFPNAWVARSARTVADWYEMYPLLCQAPEKDVATYQRNEAPADPVGPRAQSARVVRWDGHEGEVEHDGTVDLVIRRTYYPGWTATLNGTTTVPIARVDGGYQAVRIPGAGRTRVRVRYVPKRLAVLAGLSLLATASAVAVLVLAARPGHVNAG